MLFCNLTKEPSILISFSENGNNIQQQQQQQQQQQRIRLFFNLGQLYPDIYSTYLNNVRILPAFVSFHVWTEFDSHFPALLDHRVGVVLDTLHVHKQARCYDVIDGGRLISAGGHLLPPEQ